MLNHFHIPHYLQKSKQLYVIVIDHNGNYLYSNAFYSRRMANTPLSKGESMFQHLHQNYIPLLRQLLKNRESNIHRTKVLPLRKISEEEGDFFYIEWEFSYDITNQWFIGVGIDTTEQEDKLNTILNNLPEIVIIFDRKRKYREIFTLDENLLILPKHKMLNRTIEEVSEEAGLDLGERVKTLEKVFREGRVDNFEYSILKNEQETHFIANGVRFTYKNEPYVLWIIRDISNIKFLSSKLEQQKIILEKNEKILTKAVHNLKKKEKQLKAQAKELIEANQKIQYQNEKLADIAFTQAHIVRSPVATILGLSNLIDRQRLDDENYQVIELLDRTTKKLDEVIKNIIREAEAEI